MTPDQATSLRELRLAEVRREPELEEAPAGRRRRGKVISVASGKGGVGKTTLALNLSLALHRRRQGVVLVDADWGLGNVDVALGMAPQYHLGHVLFADMAIRDVVMQGPGGIRFVPNGSGDKALAELDRADRLRLLRQVEDLARDQDVVVIDTSPGISPATRDLVRFADLALVITTPEPTSMADAYAMVKLNGELDAGQRLGLVVNNAATHADAQRAAAQLSRVCERFLGWSPTLFGWIPHDDEVIRAVAEQRALLESSSGKACSAINQLARVVLGVLGRAQDSQL